MSPKVNVIVQLEFELAYFKAKIEHFNHGDSSFVDGEWEALKWKNDFENLTASKLGGKFTLEVAAIRH